MSRLSFFQSSYVAGAAIINTPCQTQTASKITEVDDQLSTVNNYMVYQPQQRRRHHHHRRSNITYTSSKALSFLPVVVGLLCMSVLAAAQNNCQCAPLGYRFKLNLQSPVCDPDQSFDPQIIANVFGENSGVGEYTCQSRTLQTVNSAQLIFQLRDNTVATDTQRNLDLSPGSTIEFEYPGPFPEAFDRITLVLTSGSGDSKVVNTGSIVFTRECGLFALETTAEENRQWGLAQFDKVSYSNDPTIQAQCGNNPPSLDYPDYPPRVFSKSGKGKKSGKHSKNLNSKYDGYGDGSGKSGKSKAFKSGKSKGSKSRRVLQDATLANAKRESHPTTTLKEQRLQTQGRLRRRMLT